MIINRSIFMSCMAINACLTLSCVDDQASQNKFATASHTGAIQAYSAYTSTMSQPNFSATLTSMRNTDYLTLYQNVLQASTNDPITIDGYTFSGLHDRAVEMEGNFQTMAGTYANQGEYWDKIGFDPTQPVTLDDLQNSLDLIDKLQQIDVYAVANTHDSQALMAQFSSNEAAVLAAKGDLVMSLSIGAGLSVGSSANSSLALLGFWQSVKEMYQVVACIGTLGIWCPGSANSGPKNSNGDTVMPDGSTRNSAGVLTTQPTCGPSANGARPNTCDTSSGIQTTNIGGTPVITGVGAQPMALR